MKKKVDNLRLTAGIGFGVFTLLGLLAVLYYQERMIFSDMAFQSFLIMRDQSPAIQSGRFGAVVTQFFPWAAQELGFSLRGVLVAYSLGHIIWPALLFGWCIWLKQWRWALALLLSVLLICVKTFYWLSEMPQGLPLLLAIGAWMDARGGLERVGWWQWPLWLAAMITAFYFHPMLMYGMGFIGLFVIASREKSASAKWLFALGMIVFGMIAVVKYKVLKLDWYDAVAIKRSAAFAELWPHWFNIQSNLDFLKWCLTDYFLFPALLLFNTAMYLLQRQWFKALLAFGYPLAYLLLVNVPFHQGDKQFYLENLWLPLGMFVAIPFVFDHVFSLLPPKKALSLISVILLVKIIHIQQAHHTWTNRLDWERGFLQKTANWSQRKLILDEKQAPMDTLIFSWGTPYEFLYLSALNHPDSARCIIIDPNPARLEQDRTRPDLFLGPFKHHPLIDLPPHYFHITDTSDYICPKF